MMHSSEQYRNPTVNEVLCRLDFPPILRVSRELPADFQEKIRKEYPIYNQNEGQSRANPRAGDERVLTSIPGTPLNTHTFSTERNDETITIAPDFLFFSTKKYVGWDDFRQRFDEAFKLFEEVYNPKYYIRIGLRYLDVVIRSKYGLVDKKWADIINPESLGHLSNGQIEGDHFSNVCDLRFKDSGERARISTAIVLDSNISLPADKREKYLLSDTDIYTMDKVSASELNEALDRLHERAGSLFRSMPKPMLERAMGSI